MALEIEHPPCEFCKTPTLDLVIQGKTGEKRVCGDCLWLALEQAHRFLALHKVNGHHHPDQEGL